MHNILLKIIEKKKQDLIEQKRSVLQSLLKDEINKTNSIGASNTNSRFLNAFLSTEASAKAERLPLNTINIIAEIKLASPTISHSGSHGEIIERAIAYEKAGADAISFITEKYYFKGDISFISKLKQHVTLPILQKDFVIDEYQIYEAKHAGSDALLLIVRYLDTETLKQFVSLCQQLDIEPVVEINDEEDLAKAVATTTNVIGVNARDLRTLNIDVDKACRLVKKIPDKFLTLGFSGIHSANEVKKYQDAGVKGILIGTELMKAKNINEFINNLRM